MSDKEAVRLAEQIVNHAFGDLVGVSVSLDIKGHQLMVT